MSDVVIFIVGTAVFGIALSGTMGSIIPAEHKTASMRQAHTKEGDAVDG